VAINCAAIPAELLEEELFGKAPGSGSGSGGGGSGGGSGGGGSGGTAGGGRDEGLLASARGGTIFCDEIAEMTSAAQPALLRLLENRAAAAPYDLRYLFASSRSLSAEVAAGRFREDLFFRITVIDVEMPPLRQRGNDVLDLAALFMEELSAQLRLRPLAFTPAARGAILRHGWPGNIRELSNFIERALIFDRFPLETLSPPVAAEIEPLDSVERRHILTALEAAGGNRSEAARRLGVSRKTIDRKCAAWGL